MQPTNKEIMRGAQDFAPINIALDPIMVDLRTKVETIDESNIMRDMQQVQIMRMVAKHGKILAKQSKLLKAHDQRIAFQN